MRTPLRTLPALGVSLVQGLAVVAVVDLDAQSRHIELRPFEVDIYRNKVRYRSSESSMYS
jgi:hypothetical protein